MAGCDCVIVGRQPCSTLVECNSQYLVASMDVSGFACPICAEHTGVVVVTADCGADHALCPNCAAKWFTGCSRCHLCNASVSTVDVHLLSSAVKEGEPQDIARSIKEASLARNVFSVRAQTQLKAEVLSEAEVIASLPTEVCQGKISICGLLCSRGQQRCSAGWIGEALAHTKYVP